MGFQLPRHLVQNDGEMAKVERMGEDPRSTKISAMLLYFAIFRCL